MLDESLDMKLELDELEKVGLHSETLVCTHSKSSLSCSLGIIPTSVPDMHNCLQDPLNPYITMTIGDFVDSLDDPSSTNFALDLPLLHKSMPKLIE